jgi:hypothetical protein
MAVTGLVRRSRTGHRGSPGTRVRNHHRKRVRRGRLAVGGLAVVAVLGVAGGAFALRPGPSMLDSKTVCLYTGSVTELTALSNLAGRPVNCAVVYNDANPGWAQWADPWFTTANDTDWTHWLKADPTARRIVVTQEMVPDNVPANWRVLGAQGTYDHYARELAVNLVAAGMGNAIIRLGHEMNGSWYHDSLGDNPAQFADWATYWARIVRVMRSVKGAHFLFDWNVNAGYRDIPLNSFYPGNDVVDMIGIDIYDTGMPGHPASQAARWRSLDTEGDGLAQIAAFARSHGKPLSFPEWGVVSSAAGGAGDDAAYVQGIINAIKDNNVVYQSYFDQPTGGVLLLQDSPKSLSLWERYFGPKGTLSGRPW